MTMLFALCLALAGTATFTACSADDPYFTVTEDDDPRILNTDLSDKTLDRKSNLKIEIRVTPMQYTTVTWLLNGVQIFEGATLDQTLPVGNHVLKIVATTTKGKSTSRTINVTVLPADGDPVLAADAKSRWLTVGATKTVACENVTSVSRVIVGDKEATNVSYADGHITFTVPTMDEGEYMLFIEDASGTRYGCGMFTVSNDAYVDPGIKETVLWEGATDINWGDSNVTITAETLAGVPVGATIRVCYEIIEAEYHALRITTPWWGDNAEDQVVAQFDLTAETPNPFEFTYTEANKAIVDERGGMLVVGFGYKLTKVIAVENAGPVENTLWEGATDINWGDSNVTITAEEMATVPVGATMRVYYDVIEADYHALRITTPWWGDNAEDQVVAQFDLTAETPNPYVFTYTEANKAIVDERGGMLVVGFGYKLTRITYE
ncbi:MAG: hypothetical protein IJS59_03850 [Bacteroidaceae bacterium]|nr:hypothetical protein [Bacteroidaceae bacterium]